MLRPTFLGFETAKRGLTAAQKGLDIAGQNLTNWDSAGYTRQRITQVALAPDSYRSRYATSKVGLAGQGVEITGIDQTRDVFLDKRFREENGDLGYYGQAYTVLADIQASINEFNPNTDVGLRSCMLSLNKALQNFAGNAYSETHANIVMTEFKNLTQTLQQISSKLQDSREQQIYDLEISVGDVNKKLQQIAGLNQAIMESMTVTQDNAYFGPNELLDQRNLLLDELSQYMDLQYENNADGTVTVSVNGQTVVSGSKYDKMELMENPKTGVVDLRWISSNETVNLTTGALKASVDYTNGRGPNLKNPGESTVKGFLYYQDKLNTFAQTLADTVNNIIPEVDANGILVLYRDLLDDLADKLIVELRVATMLEDLFFLRCVFIILECDPVFLLNDILYLIYDVIDTLIPRFCGTGHIDMALQLSGVILAGEHTELLNESITLFCCDEP